jgi:membrane fusion protein, heavy metal efflux system
MKFNSIFIIIAGFALLLHLAGCQKADSGHSHGPGADHAHVPDDIQTLSITKWTENMELFTEYTMPVKGEDTKFIIHLTKLADFQPVHSGRISLIFNEPNKNINHKVGYGRLLREGIFTPLIAFPEAGFYKGTIKYSGEGLDESIDIGTVRVFESYDDLPDFTPEAGLGDEISYLKEQQWKSEFSTCDASIKPVKPSVSAVAEILPRQQGYVKVIAPVSGILGIRINKYMAAPGSQVKRGDLVALISPLSGGGNSWQQLKSALNQAKNNFERAKRLKKDGAISIREFENLERQYLLLSAGFPAQGKKASRGNLFRVTAPIDGTVEHVPVVLGQQVQRGTALMTIVNTSKVWLKVNLFERDFNRLGTPSGASLQVPGLQSSLYLSPEEMTLLGKGQVLDRHTQTIPLRFEIDNPKSIFKIGQVFQAQLALDQEKHALCVPIQSLYEDEGHMVVFVQAQGETFEKRVVKTGSSTNGWVEIISGIKKGERVVEKGAYLVKLASTSTPIGHGHAH